MGKFTNEVKVAWIVDKPRNMRVLENTSYIDDNGVEWIARAGDVIDGASIPKWLWPFIGSPFVGLFRYASVYHDVYCRNKTRPHKAVHKMFKQAMRDSGVPRWKRKPMAKAVSHFGPKW